MAKHPVRRDERTGTITMTVMCVSDVLSTPMSRVPVTPTTPFDELPQFLTVRDAAAYTQQSTWTIYQAVAEGRIPGTKRFGRKRVLIPREDFCVKTVVEEAVL